VTRHQPPGSPGGEPSLPAGAANRGDEKIRSTDRRIARPAARRATHPPRTKIDRGQRAIQHISAGSGEQAPDHLGPAVGHKRSTTPTSGVMVGPKDSAPIHAARPAARHCMGKRRVRLDALGGFDRA
jgi:hypothetical protein